MSMKSGWKGSDEGTDDFDRIVLVKGKESKLDWAAFTKTNTNKNGTGNRKRRRESFPALTDKKARIRRELLDKKVEP